MNRRLIGSKLNIANNLTAVWLYNANESNLIMWLLFQKRERENILALSICSQVGACMQQNLDHIGALIRSV